MTVEAYDNGDGSYQWVAGTFTDADVQACIASGDSTAWLKANATILPKPVPKVGT